MRLARVAVLPLALVLVVAGCSSGGGGLSDAEQELADAWAATLEDDEDGFEAGPADAACMGDAIMAELGEGPFEDAGVTAAGIGGSDDENSPGEVLGADVVSEEQADAILDAWEDCVNLPRLLASASASDFDLDEEAQSCVADGLDEDDLGRELLRPSFTNDDDTPDDDLLVQFIELVDSCGGGEQGGALAQEIAASLSGGQLTDEDAQCIAEALIDDVGAARLVELTAGGDVDNAPPEAQEEIAQALIAAAGACDVPLSSLGG